MKGQINLSLPDTVVGFRNLERRVRYRKPTRTLTPHRSVYFVKRHSDRHAPWVSRERNLRSKIRWFTEFCNSHYLSQLATFVIEARTKRFTVRSCHSVKFSTRVAKINWTFHCGLKCKIYEHVRGRVPFERPIWDASATPHDRDNSQWFSTLAEASEKAVMILPQVHLRKPCYDFSFL